MLAVKVGGHQASKIDRFRSEFFDGIIRPWEDDRACSTANCSSRRMMSSRVLARPFEVMTKQSR